MKQSTIFVGFILLSVAVFCVEAFIDEFGPRVKQCTFDNLDDPKDKGQIQITFKPVFHKGIKRKQEFNNVIRIGWRNSEQFVNQSRRRIVVFAEFMRTSSLSGKPASSCVFKKARSSSALRVTYQGDMRLEICSNRRCCRRWFITINGKECSSPAPIEVAIHAGGDSNVNLHRPATIDGICSDIPKGNLTVGLSVGNCKNWPYDEGNAHTCWGSCRLIIEEISSLQ